MLAKRLLGKKDAKPSWIRKALLEILVIIIGILLSLAISEWFSNRKENRQETAYLQELSKDISGDLVILEYDLEQRSDQLQSCSHLLEAVKTGGTEVLRTPLLTQTVVELANSVSFSPNRATFQALESTGRVELIDNDSIVRSLIELYTFRYDLVNQNNVDVSMYRNNFLLPFMVTQLDFSAALDASIVDPLLTSDSTVYTEVLNHVIYHQISLRSTVQAYARAIKHAKETLAIIERELD